MIAPVPAAAELVLRFLASVGRPAEAEQYLALFRSEHPESFAVLHISAPVLDQALDALAVDLRFLVELGLCPILAYGAVAPRDEGDTYRRLVKALGNDIPCQRATIENAAELARRDVLPLVPLAPAKDVATNEAAEDRRFDELTRLVARVRASKLIFVGRRSGLQPNDGRVIPMLDSNEIGNVLPTLPLQQRKLLRQIARTFAVVGHPLTVAITSPLDLLRELFTVKGAGTLVRRASVIARYRAWDELAKPELVEVVEDAFGKTLAPDYFRHTLRCAYVADTYRGVALVTDTPQGPYLSKFAVSTVARGEGVGRDLWRAMQADLPQFFWRSRNENPITAWYREQCDGLHRTFINEQPWTIFWRGVAPSAIAPIIDYCTSLPPELVPRHSEADGLRATNRAERKA